MTIDDELNMVRVGSVLLSPDGNTVFYSKSELDWKKNKRKSSYYIISANGGVAKQYIGDAGGGSFQFSPDGTSLSFIRKVDDDGQLFLMSTSGGEAIQYTDHKGEYKGKRLLSEENYEELITPNMITSYEDGLSREKKPAWPDLYGLGWWLGDYNGHRGVHHGGSSIGTLSQVFFMPDKNFGVVTFVNVETYLSDELVLFIIDLYEDELNEE